MSKDPYEVLGVSPYSDQEVIEAAYRALMRKCHPDVNGSSTATSRASKLNEAYALIGDPDSRRQFDRERTASRQRVAIRANQSEGRDVESSSTRGKPCPECAETVQQAALLCRYCGYEFVRRRRPLERSDRDQPPNAHQTTIYNQLHSPPVQTNRRSCMGTLGRGLIVLLALLGILAIIGAFELLGDGYVDVQPTSEGD